MKKWQLSGVIVGLLVVLYGLNVVTQLQQEKAQKLAKAAAAAKQAAEQKAASKVPDKHAGKAGPALFKLPRPLGPAGAPIKIEVFVDNTNSCHQASLQLQDLGKIYGSKLRVEFYNMGDPKVSERTDKLALGCDAGLAFNGKVELMVRTAVGKKLIAFRGPAGDKYRPADVYAAVNTLLAGMGKPVPAAGVTAAKTSGLGTHE